MDVAVASMNRGQIAHVIIPPLYAYGDCGYPPVVPPGATVCMLYNVWHFSYFLVVIFWNWVDWLLSGIILQFRSKKISCWSYDYKNFYFVVKDIFSASRVCYGRKYGNNCIFFLCTLLNTWRSPTRWKFSKVAFYLIVKTLFCEWNRI